MKELANEMDRKMVVGVTVGNASGIGPEIVLKSLAKLASERFIPVVIGDLNFLEEQNSRFNTGLKFVEFSSRSMDVADAIPIVDLKNLPDEIEVGTENALAGRASGEYIEKAVSMWSDGELDAIATAPISKRSLAMGGYDYPGHTEFLAALTGTDRFAMSFFCGAASRRFDVYSRPIVDGDRDDHVNATFGYY
jgi:Pyridoxal phosphate biosynthesis protein